MRGSFSPDRDRAFLLLVISSISAGSSEAQKKAAFTEWQKKPVGGKAAPGLDLGDVEAAIRRLIPRSVMAMDQVDYDGFIKAQTKKVFEAVDVDQSGLVEEDEFLRLCEFLRDTAFQVQTKVSTMLLAWVPTSSSRS